MFASTLTHVCLSYHNSQTIGMYACSIKDFYHGCSIPFILDRRLLDDDENNLHSLILRMVLYHTTERVVISLISKYGHWPSPCQRVSGPQIWSPIQSRAPSRKIIRGGDSRSGMSQLLISHVQREWKHMEKSIRLFHLPPQLPYFILKKA
jgi:hypothetical protein